MHLRLVKAKSGKTVRRYAQLVESYRRDDGLPVHRVLASLGQLSDREIANFRLALEASRTSKTVVLPEAPKWRAKVLANLAYLDIAVALEMWRSWELSELLHRLIPERDVAVRAAEVICALTIQRCVAPGSKLYAQRWFPRTALPELLGVAPARFHNTRIHRVLDKLDRIETELQDGLVRRYERRDATFATLFTDVTDAWFEGRGPDLAQRSRTKEGLHNRHKIGILLLCNEHGYPLRWSTLPGRTQDGRALHELVETIEGKSWAQGVPIVFDRAMGSVGAGARLCKSELRFLTAVRRPEIRGYTKELPSEPLADLQGSEDEQEREQLIAEAGARVAAAGMQKVDEQLYVLDLGIATRRLRLVSNALEPNVDAAKLEGGALWLHRARAYRSQIEDKSFKTQSEIARHVGVTRARMTQIMTLLRLDETLQKEVLASNYGYIADRTLRAIANLRSKAAQRRALEEHGESARPMDPSQNPKRFQHTSMVDASLRLVLYFNPQMFVDMRTMGERHRAEIDAYLRDLNARLRRKGNKATRESVYSSITGKLASRSMLSIYTVQIDENNDDSHEHLVVSLRFDETAWNKRRSTDGFVLLVAHPELPQSAAEMVALFRAKDAVEKDFQTIKSDLELRPVFHHTDPKVRAHVSLCMLALLLERTLERRLRKAGKAMTAPAIFEDLAGGHLNMVATGPDESVAYVPTEPSTEQRELLALLRLEDLADQDHLAARIEPRTAS
jgi:transposase